MSNLAIEDLELNQDLDKNALANITGGWIRGTYSTADLHKAIYGKGSPYGRNPATTFGYTPIGKSTRSFSWGF